MKLALLLLLTACAGPLDVTRRVTPSQAASARDSKLRPTAIIRNGARAELPDGVIVDADKVHVPRPGTYVYPMEPNEELVKDDKGNVVAVKTPGNPPTLTRFVAGTVEVAGNEVRGELEGGEERVPLYAGDKIELKGTVVPGDKVPGGKVEETRGWSALIVGLATFGFAYIPSVIVGASSEIDRWLLMPIAGPWIELATRKDCTPDDSPDNPDCFHNAFARVGIIIDGIVQASGAAMTLVSIPSKTEIIDDTPPEPKTTVQIGVSPKGVFVRGTFSAKAILRAWPSRDIS